MVVAVKAQELTYQARIDSLRETKLRHTREKQELIGSMDYDDWSLVLPPPEYRRVVRLMGASGVPIPTGPINPVVKKSAVEK